MLPTLLQPAYSQKIKPTPWAVCVSLLAYFEFLFVPAYRDASLIYRGLAIFTRARLWGLEASGMDRVSVARPLAVRIYGLSLSLAAEVKFYPLPMHADWNCNGGTIGGISLHYVGC